MDRREDVGGDAADTPNVLNPIVGISREDLAAAAWSILTGSVRQPFSVMRHAGAYGRTLVDIVFGDADLWPDEKDRRFKDPAWLFSPVHRRAMQAWLAFGAEARGFVDGLKLDALDKARAQLLASILIDAVSPTNTLVGNPSALKRVVDTGGLSLLRGLGNFVDDMRNNHQMPLQVDKKPFKVGENVACTPGQVVLRTEMFELLQYTPTTQKVYERPLLFVPPQINKYYVLDLAPEKSMARWLVAQGFQVFVVSWRNPQPEHRDWGLADYVASLIEASDAVRAITGSKTLNVSGGCSGGITTATLLSQLAAEGDDRMNSVTLWVCVLDPRQTDSEFGVLVSKRGIEIARGRSRKKGVLTGVDLSRTFAWLRPNDLIWNYVVNNYLHGDPPPAFDVLFWNNDSTNLPAQLHSDYLDLYVEQPFANPGKVEFMGHPIDLRKVEIDSFIVAGITDHITPWKACYRTVGMMGGNKEFVLSSSGHIQAILNPPGNPRAKYFANAELPATADAWLQGAHEVKGSWWERWAVWLAERSGDQKPAPKSAGNRKFRPLEAAPGSYVKG